MSIPTAEEPPVVTRAMFPAAQDFTIRHVVGGDMNVYNTIYTDNVQATPSQSGRAQETISNTQLSDTASSWEVPTILYRILQPFWIYSRGSEGKQDFSVSQLDDSAAPPTRNTSGEVYVSAMLHAGQGLPCWKPRPREPLQVGEGVILGDVGIFSVEGGFKKIFNLWDDEEAIQDSPAARSYHIRYDIPPKPRILVNMTELAEGKALVEGVWYETFYARDDQTITRFEFHHMETHRQGAVLALTSAGKLEELDESANGLDLQEFISRYAGLLYKYANAIRSIKEAEALYIITGCIKSESWALAAFRDPVLHPHHVPRLVKLSGGPPDNSAQSSVFGWRSPGTFDSYVGKSEVNGSQDQTLFLRGFKLDFSQSFRSQAKCGQAPPTRNHESDGSSSFGSHHSKGGGRDGQTGGDSGGGGGEGSSGGSWGASGRTGGQGAYEAADDCFIVTPFPDDSHQESCHPCDIINKFLLEETSLDFALSHDDDWRFILNGASKPEFTFDPAMEEHSSRVISVQHGVACLSSLGRRNEWIRATQVDAKLLAAEPSEADLKAREEVSDAPASMILPVQAIGREDSTSSTDLHASPKDNTFWISSLSSLQDRTPPRHEKQFEEFLRAPQRTKNLMDAGSLVNSEASTLNMGAKRELEVEIEVESPPEPVVTKRKRFFQDRPPKDVEMGEVVEPTTAPSSGSSEPDDSTTQFKGNDELDVLPPGISIHSNETKPTSLAPPPPPKVKLSLKDFAARRKKQKEEEKRRGGR